MSPEHATVGPTRRLSPTPTSTSRTQRRWSTAGLGNLLATYSYVDRAVVVGDQHTHVSGVATCRISEHREYIGEIRFATRLDGAWNFLRRRLRRGSQGRSDGRQSLVCRSGHDPRAAGPRRPDWTSGCLPRDGGRLNRQPSSARRPGSSVESLTLTGGIRGYEYDRRYSPGCHGRLLRCRRHSCERNGRAIPAATFART